MISTSEFDYYSKIFNFYELFDSTRFLRWFGKRHQQGLRKELTLEEKDSLNSFLKTRLGGKSEVFKEFNYFSENKSALKQIEIDQSKKNVFLFSSVYWDLGLNELNTIFDDMFIYIYISN